MPTVVLVGTFDTKGEEYAFLRDRVGESNCEIVMINAGVLGDAGYPVEFERADVAAAAGADLDVVAGTGDRGAAVTIMAEGAAAIVRGLYETGRLHGILGMGGSGGSSIISRAMRELPIGVPKMLVSTMASGDIRAFVGTSDMAMMSSVVDIAGINQISSRILLVAATMYGTTTPCVDRARLWLDEAGYEVLVFHATGAGGRSMESLMKSGLIDASLDITTAELAAEVAGGSLTAGPDRLEVAGSLGLPQVVSLGGVDQIAITPPEAMPAEWGDRDTYEHNPAITLVRANPDEARRLGRLIARKLNAASGPVTLFVPLRGTSSYAVEGGVFHDPDADLALFESLREHLGPSVEVVEMDTDINDAEFAVAMATRLDEHYRRVLADGDSGF
jgi:uncharacterized protein (UPF0261 family)